MTKINLKWKFSKKLLWSTFLIAILVPLIGKFWILARFDLPFVHGGDKGPIYFIMLLWWVACSILIFGWKANRDILK